MSLDDSGLLPGLYDGLATPPVSPHPTHGRLALSKPAPVTPYHSNPPTPISSSPHPPALDLLVTGVSLPTGSLLPTQIRRPPGTPLLLLRPGFDHPDSLTREKKGKMPALSHLLSVGKGRVLSLAADGKYVYAGCQSAENEIVVRSHLLVVGLAHLKVFSRSSLQPMFRLLGHQGSVLELMVVEEKQWLVSSSSAGDIRVGLLI